MDEPLVKRYYMMNQKSFIFVSLVVILSSHLSFAQSIEKINFKSPENRLFVHSSDQTKWNKAKNKYAKIIERLVKDHPRIDCEERLSSEKLMLTSECFHSRVLPVEYDGYFLDHWKEVDQRLLLLLSSRPLVSDSSEVQAWASALQEEVQYLQSLEYEDGGRYLADGEVEDGASLADLNRAEFEKSEAKHAFHQRWFIQKHVPRYGKIRPKQDRDLPRMGQMKKSSQGFTQAELRSMAEDGLSLEFSEEECEELALNRALRKLNVVRGSDEMPHLHSAHLELGANSVFLFSPTE